ncbi:MAG: energy-coupling factor ABC transporter ATP-binding protein, partial [Schaedlerella arabinosiphila]|nr:energy-coupling factor ABC transporter ATP-binding protein [Schaedlerella arabinosiphila]
MKEPIIKFEDFGFQYDAQAEPTLKNINLEIYPGEKILIAGPSGCGKSTLTHCMNGLIPFAYPGESTGKLTIQNKETKKLSIFEISRMVGTVLQDLDGQFIGLTVAEDIAFALENACVGQEDMKKAVRQVARQVGIEGHLEHSPDALSGGQKQRVSMAGVMVNEVGILLFDEPLANLDPATGKKAIEIIDRIQKETGATVVIIEHRLEDVLWRDVDRIVLMKDGRIVKDAPPDELLSTDVLQENGIR